MARIRRRSQPQDELLRYRIPAANQGKESVISRRDREEEHAQDQPQGKPKESELPGTLKRSPKKAQKTFAKAHDSAADQYGDDERAHRVAFSALKHTHEKVGDHWEPKDEKGPSDPRAKNPRARENRGKTFGGSTSNGNSKKELYERAQKLGIKGRSSMSKEELAEAISKKQ